MKNALKRLIKKTPLLPLLRRVKRNLSNVERHPLQTLKTATGYKLKSLGTEYGGWVFVDDPELHGATIISAGLGEDGSFDVEFARFYNATVIIVDPTPRAIEHFKGIANRFGQKNTVGYSYDSKEPVEAYNLQGLTKDNLQLATKALWNEKTTLKFFEPANPEHVSHSIVNFQNNYRDDTNYIEVEALTTSDLLEELKVDESSVKLVKLDIEGAEIEVITEFLDQGLRPRQILVEFDELNKPSERAFKRVDQINQTLEQYSYKCIHTDGQADFLYVLTSAFEPN